MIFLDHPFLKLGANVKHFYVLWAWNKHYDKLDYRFILAGFPLVFLLLHFGMLCNTSELMEIVFLWDCHHCAGSSRLLVWCVTSSGFCWSVICCVWIALWGAVLECMIKHITIECGFCGGSLWARGSGKQHNKKQWQCPTFFSVVCKRSKKKITMAEALGCPLGTVGALCISVI